MKGVKYRHAAVICSMPVLDPFPQTTKTQYTISMKVISYAILTVFLLSGCVTSQPNALKTLAPAQRIQQAQHIQQWSIWGVLSLRSPDQSVIATYRWQQQNQHYQLQLEAPLNVGSIFIEGSPGQVTLSPNANQHFTAQSPEELMEQQLGWQLPISNLQSWIRGIPAPGSSSQPTYDQQGHLTSLIQQGWQIKFLDYQTINNTLDLPGQLQLTTQSLAVKIIIKQWKLP